MTDNSRLPNSGPSQYSGKRPNDRRGPMSRSCVATRAVAPQPGPGSVARPAPGSHAGSMLSAPPFESHVIHLPSVPIEYSSRPPPSDPSGELRSLSNAILAPSGDQAGALSSPFVWVRRRWAVPSALITYSSLFAVQSSKHVAPFRSRSETNAIREPSGDHAGELAFAARRCAPSPSELMTKTSWSIRLALTRYLIRENAIVAP